MKNLIPLKVSALGVVFALVLSACGGSGGGSNGPDVQPGPVADDPRAQFSPVATNKVSYNSYIVQMQDIPLIAYGGSDPAFKSTRPAVGQKLNSASSAYQQYKSHLVLSHDDVAAAVGARKVYDYSVAFNGFSAVLTKQQVAELRARNDVVKV